MSKKLQKNKQKLAREYGKKQPLSPKETEAFDAFITKLIQQMKATAEKNESVS